jgi:hypothetical protein
MTTVSLIYTDHSHIIIFIFNFHIFNFLPAFAKALAGNTIPH